MSAAALASSAEASSYAPEILLGHRRGARPERRLVLGPGAELPGRLGEEREQLAEGAHPARQLLAAAPGLGVVGAGAEGRSGVGEGAAGIGEPPGPQRGGVEQHPRPFAGIGVLGEPARHQLQHGHLLGRLAGGGVGGGQHLGDAQGVDALRQELLQQGHRLGLLGREEPAGGDERERGAGRLSQPAQRLGQEPGPGQLQRGALGTALSQEGEPGEHPDPLLGGARARLALERGVEPPQRFLVVGTAGQDLPPHPRRPVELARLGPHPGQLRGQGGALVAARPAPLLLQRPDQLLLLAGAAHGRLQRGHGALVLGVELGQRAPGPDRLLGLAQVVVEHLGHPPEERLAGLQVGVAGAGRRPVGPGQLQVGVGARRGALHGLAGGGATGVHRQRARQRAQRVAGMGEPVLLHLRQPLQQPHALGRHALPARGEVEHLRQALPLPGLGEQWRQGVPGRAVTGVGAQGRLEVAAGAGGVGQAIPGHHRGLRPEGGVARLLRGRRQVSLQRLERPGEAAGVELQLEGVERCHLAGRVERQGRVERLERGDRVAEPDQVHPGQLEQERHLRSAVAGLRREAGQRVGVAAVVAALAVGPGQELQGELVPGGEGPGPGNLRHHPRQPLGVVGGVKLGQAQVQGGRGAPVLGLRHRRLQPDRLLAPGAREVPQALARLGGARGVPVQRQRLDERVHGQAVLERLLRQGRAQPGVLGRQGAGLGAVVARGVEELLGLPEAAHVREAGQRADPRLGEVGVEAEGAGVQQRRPVPAPEAELVDLGQAEGHLGRLAGVGSARRRLVQRRGQRGPVVVLLEELAQRVEGLAVPRVEPQELAVQVLGARPVAELLPGQGGGAGEERRARDQPGAALAERHQLLPTRRRLVQPGQGLERLEIARSRLQRL